MPAHKLRTVQVLEVPTVFNGPETSNAAHLRGRSTEEVSEDPVIGFVAIDDTASDNGLNFETFLLFDYDRGAEKVDILD